MRKMEMEIAFVMEMKMYTVLVKMEMVVLMEKATVDVILIIFLNR